MGTGVVSGPHAQKDVVSGPNAQNWLQAAQDLFDGLQNTWAHHMVSKVHGLTTMVSKMQKLCIWAEMYQNDGLRAIYPPVNDASPMLVPCTETDDDPDSQRLTR